MADEDYNEEYEEYVDDVDDEIDDSQDLKEAQLEQFGGTYPESKEKQDLFQWFWKVTRLSKPFQLVKVGNLNNTEIGQHKIPVREAMNLWVLGHTFNHGIFGNYFAQIAKITSATSMAKQGWFMDLSISQKRVRARTKGQSGEESWRAFKKKKGWLRDED